VTTNQPEATEPDTAEPVGYDPHGITYPTVDGRPTFLSDGEAIRELL